METSVIILLIVTNIITAAAINFHYKTALLNLGVYPFYFLIGKKGAMRDISIQVEVDEAYQQELFRRMKFQEKWSKK